MPPSLRNRDVDNNVDNIDDNLDVGANLDQENDADNESIDDPTQTPTTNLAPDVLATLDQATLVALIKSLVKTSNAPASKGTDVRHPNKFDGVDRSKLRTYFAQCLLVFRANPSKFDTDTKKVTYACSYLDGLAFDWYENIVDSAVEPSWFNNWTEFRTTLDYHFGEINPSHAAERKIRTLTMKGNESIITYVTKFRTYSGRLNWNDAAITAEFRRGLSTRIKDDLAKIDYEDLDFVGLEQLVIKIDARHQERRMERESERLTHPDDQTSKEERKNGNPRRSKPSSSDNIVATTTTTSTTKERPVKDNLPLDAHGKLTEEERARRKRLGLCDYCASNQHKFEDCDVKPKSNLRSATTTFSVEGFQ